MKAGPDIAALAALVGEPARANMLTALMPGRALTAGELAAEAGVTAQTASSHLGKLAAAGLIVEERQGRHRYFCLADPDVAAVLESLLGLAARLGHMRTRGPMQTQVGPADPALRRARVCYDHLAGELGVALYDSLVARGVLRRLPETIPETIGVTDAGQSVLENFGIALDGLRTTRRPLCRACLDWSVRRPHLAGALGAAIFARILDLGWARRLPQSRVVQFTPGGENKFRAEFGIDLP